MNTDTPHRPRKGLWFFVCIGILLGGFAVMSLLRAFAPEPRQVEAVVNVPAVQVAPLVHRNAPLLVSGQGIVTPRAAVTVSAQVSGEVVAMHPQLISGGDIAAGETLLEIDPRPFEAALEEAEAALQAQQVNLDLLVRQLERSESLRERDFVDENSIDDLRSRRDQARANLRRQEALVQSRRLDLEYTRITAPFDAHVLSESVDIGDIVAPGAELARIYASDRVEITVSLNDNNAALIPDLFDKNAAARPAFVRADFGGRRYEWPGEVDRIEADLDRNTRTIDIIVRVLDPNQPGRPVGDNDGPVQTSPPPLLVGMYADVSIEAMALPGHFTLPVSAVHDGNIWVIEGESRLGIAPVDIVRQEGNDYVLLAPMLPEQTQVVVSNLALVSDGMQVRIEDNTP